MKATAVHVLVQMVSALLAPTAAAAGRPPYPDAETSRLVAGQ
jgi:hypothetical protein